MNNLSYGKTYGECVTCERTFVIDKYVGYDFCPYDKSSVFPK
jgi:hypothetical protein